MHFLAWAMCFLGMLHCHELSPGNNCGKTKGEACWRANISKGDSAMRQSIKTSKGAVTLLEERQPPSCHHFSSFSSSKCRKHAYFCTCRSLSVPGLAVQKAEKQFRRQWFNC
uniref:Putative secreted protein n=1 Tax=Ixodes ricinus TaxID=34613 RepID=A0A6B0UJR8_IXORI